ncbi:hypothetical protein [Allomesorhizobium alhagi]|uniref:Uncharacterized protein n=1 Tax=Mesorhizobium alhagi CCNWXJ12-2 TaxID=1107882 RepID=H0HR65_9HYPH|nr:hypothetical protein [Mesorhizobium alhagi]EHK56775.1 hypothetical protein MAXJ12_13241 [Mesorhizobium alhagi CCNWXJ12-2]
MISEKVQERIDARKAASESVNDNAPRQTSDFKPTFDFKAYRVRSVDCAAMADGFTQITVGYSAVRAPQIVWAMEFMHGADVHGESFVSPRFQAFLSSLHMSSIDDGDQLVGRYFAVRDGGNKPDEFATLEYASACLRCDMDAYQCRLAYAAQYAADEAKAGEYPIAA